MSLKKSLKIAIESGDDLKLEDVFEQIYNEYYKLVYFIVIKIIKNEELTKEIVNDVFLKAFNNLNKFDFNSTSSSLKSWIVQIAKNEAINNYHKKQKENVEFSDFTNMESRHDGFFDFIKEFQGFLTDEEIEILILRIYYNFKLKEIAKYYKTTTSVVYTKYQNALKTLKQYYKRGDFHDQK